MSAGDVSFRDVKIKIQGRNWDQWMWIDVMLGSVS